MKTSRPISKLSLLLLLLLLGAGRTALAQDARPSDPSPGEARSASVQRISVAAAAVLRTSPFDPPDASDISFHTDVAPKLDTGCTFRSGGPLVYNIEIKRFIGELNPDGTLKDAAALVAAGLLSPKVKLIMPGFDIDSGPPPPDVAPEVDRVSFNGQPVGVLSGQNNQWVLNSFEIPVGKVKFAEAGADDGEPVGGVNEVRIDIDTANTTEVWCTSVDWGSASFKAASPIILIHGSGSDGGFFDRQGFTRALRDQKLVYNNKISMKTKARGENAEDLNRLIPAIAKKLGAKHVHLVTHSKGGTDTRDYLARFQRHHQGEFKVLSLTTLSGPHDGSVGADLRVERKIAAKNVGWTGKIEYVGFPEYTRFLAFIMGADDATRGLTTDSLALYNPRNIPRLTGLGVTYHTVGADADRNFNLRIDRSPVSEYAELRLENPALLGLDLFVDPEEARKIVDTMYQIVRRTARVNVTYRKSWGRTIATITSIPPEKYRQNDTMVTLDSAKGLGGFRFLVSKTHDYTGVLGRNHASVANEAVGRAVIPWILDVERQRGGLR